MKNKGLIITMIVLLSIIIVLLIGILCMGIMGKGRFPMGINLGKAEVKIFDQAYDLASINNIKVKSSAGDVKFEESKSEEIRVVVYGQEDNSLKVSNNNGKLDIDYTERKTNLFSFNYTSEIIVYLPKSYDKEIDIESDYGNVEVLDLEKATAKINQSCGSVDLGKIKNVEIDNDFGDVKIASVLNKLNINTDCGSIKIENLELKENSYIDSDMGDVKIGKTNEIYFETKVDLGNCKIANNYRHAEVTLKIDSDCGDIKVEN